MAAAVAAVLSGALALGGAATYLKHKRGQRELVAYRDSHFVQVDGKLDLSQAELVQVQPGVDVNIGRALNYVAADLLANYNPYETLNRPYPQNPNSYSNKFAAAQQRQEVMDVDTVKWLQKQIVWANTLRHSTYSDDNPLEMTERMIHKILPPIQPRDHSRLGLE